MHTTKFNTLIAHEKDIHSQVQYFDNVIEPVSLNLSLLYIYNHMIGDLLAGLQIKQVYIER